MVKGTAGFTPLGKESGTRFNTFGEQLINFLQLRMTTQQL